jgi:hypothetical protein
MASEQRPSGLFIPTTNVWDVSPINNAAGLSPDLKELLVRLYQNINNISLAINLKDTGYYDQQQFVNGQKYFPNPALTSSSSQTPVYRPVTRKVINFGALPNAASKSVAHGLTVTADWSFTRIYGTATNPSTSFIPIPFASPTLNQIIKLEVDATNVIITTAIDQTAYTICYVVLEYLTQ